MTIDINKIATDLNGKADVDLTNTVGAMSESAKNYFSGAGMPSNSYIDLTLGASGTTYTAPANGYFVVYKISSGSGQYMQMNNAGIDNKSATNLTIFSTASSQHIGCTLPCAKNQKMRIGYTLGGETVYMRFCYAIGSESEA